MIKSIQNSKFRSLLQPVSSSAVLNTPYTSLRNAKRCVINLRIGAIGAGTPAITLRQAKNVEGADDKLLTFVTGNVYSNTPGTIVSGVGTDELWVKETITGGTLNAAANTNYKFEIRNDQLDANNNYDCIALSLAAGTNVLRQCDIELHDLTHSGEVNDRDVVPSAGVNSEATLV